jgi:hypothetical protein
MCNSLTNIICVSCNNNYKNKKVWLCVYHWKQHRIDNHKQTESNLNSQH